MRVKKGEIYIAANGSKCGHLVIDVVKYKHCDDVVTQPFTTNGIYGLNLLNYHGEEVAPLTPNRIDKFKLTMVRYYRCDDLEIPEWVPSEIIIKRSNL